MDKKMIVIHCHICGLELDPFHENSFCLLHERDLYEYNATWLKRLRTGVGTPKPIKLGVYLHKSCLDKSRREIHDKK